MCAPRRIVRFRRLLQADKDKRFPSVLYDSYSPKEYRLIPVTFRQQYSLTTIRIAFLAATTRESVSTFVCWESSATRRTLLPVTTQWVRPILLLVSLKLFLFSHANPEKPACLLPTRSARNLWVLFGWCVANTHTADEHECSTSEAGGEVLVSKKDGGRVFRV